MQCPQIFDEKKQVLPHWWIFFLSVFWRIKSYFVMELELYFLSVIWRVTLIYITFKWNNCFGELLFDLIINLFSGTIVGFGGLFQYWNCSPGSVNHTLVHEVSYRHLHLSGAKGGPNSSRVAVKCGVWWGQVSIPKIKSTDLEV